MQRKRLYAIQCQSTATVRDTVKDYRSGRGVPVTIEGTAKDEYSCRAMIGLLEEEIKNNIEKSEKAAEEIERYIQTVDDPKVRELMRSRFLDCLSWEKVGKVNYMSPDHARKIVRNFIKQI